jgi:hypothetical protein
MRYTSRFPPIFCRISIQLKKNFYPGKEFFNRIGQNRSFSGANSPRPEAAIA